jgi:hypothetical protein
MGQYLKIRIITPTEHIYRIRMAGEHILNGHFQKNAHFFIK